MMTFSQYALKNIRIDQDSNGLFAMVPSSDGNWYTVRCVESKKSVYASHCSCRTFAKHQHCTHVETVQCYYGKLYKVEAPVVEVAPVVEAPKVAKTRKPRNGLVRKVRGGGLVRVEQPSPVGKVIEQPATVEAPKVVESPLKAWVDGKISTQELAAKSMPVATRQSEDWNSDISTKGNLYTNRGFQILR